MAALLIEHAGKARHARVLARPRTESVIYAAQDLPIFQNWMFDTRDEARSCARGDVRLVRDPSSGLIVNQSFDALAMDYDAHYQNEQAGSGVFREHLSEVAAIIDRHLAGRTLIEVGCGKGHFLEQLLARGYLATGVDPAYEGANPNVIRQYFAPELKVRADGIVLRHVLEHVQNPIDFLEGIRDINGGGGKIYIEVPCFDWICSRRAWFDVFYEHVNYFRLNDFYRMFGVVHESGHLFGGQYLYVVAELASLRRTAGRGLDGLAFPADFSSGVARHVGFLRSQGQTKTALWGGASKGVIFGVFMERAGADIDLVIDTNPAKQGKYLPGTGLKVHSPAEALARLPDGSNIIVMNSNYLAEIRSMAGSRYRYSTADHGLI